MIIDCKTYTNLLTVSSASLTKMKVSRSPITKYLVVFSKHTKFPRSILFHPIMVLVSPACSSYTLVLSVTNTRHLTTHMAVLIS